MLWLGRDSGCLCLEQRQQGNKVCSSEDLGRFPFTNQNFPKFGNSGKLCRNFREIFQKFRKLFMFRNANHDSTSKILEIPGAKLNGKKKFREKLTLKKFKYTLRGCLIFGIFSKMLFHSSCWLLEAAENFTQTFWLNGKRSCTSDKTVFDRIGQFSIWRLCHPIGATVRKCGRPTNHIHWVYWDVFSEGFLYSY